MKRGGFLKRKTPLRRLSPIAKRRTKQRRNEYRDEAYKAHIRTLACLCDGRDPKCRNDVQAHHVVKSDDRSCIPLSSWCHLEGWHGRVNGRKGWVGAMGIDARNKWGELWAGLLWARYAIEVGEKRRGVAGERAA